ncbi:hypothetical protein WA026_007551 [Henosepilachna vigintioctopunctata]|uniref:Endonuclease/exonuclease/phosphatase domain-containing protein n=1 Tax=Henosepilachna vigintioctopunctata TaxID=420089 RepID=A0AAW1UV73_9CUCU
MSIVIWCRVCILVTSGNMNNLYSVNNAGFFLFTLSRLYCTYFPTRNAQASTLDLVINKNNTISELIAINALDSDHLPISFEIFVVSLFISRYKTLLLCISCSIVLIPSWS